MDAMTVELIEWMEMDARALHSIEWTKWTVDVEWIATLAELEVPLRYLTADLASWNCVLRVWPWMPTCGPWHSGNLG